MMKIFVQVLLASLLLMACKPKVRQEIPVAPETPFHFMPFTDYFESELRMIDSLQIPTVLVETKNGQSDTLPASMADTRILATPFLNLKPLDDAYRETSFADQTIASVTLTYTAKSASTTPQRIDVIIEPNPTGEDKIKSIFTDTNESRGDTAVNTKLYWRGGKHFQIITTKQLPGKESATHIRKLEWNPGS
jgi:hypothetical protein